MTRRQKTEQLKSVLHVCQDCRITLPADPHEQPNDCIRCGVETELWDHSSCNYSGWIGPVEPCPICEAA